MLRKIRSLVSSYDEKIFAWLEGKGTSGSKCEHSSRKDGDRRSQVSQRGVGLKRPTPQVPDPWD
ncbi:hypothetical protein S-MbCM7_166 [Synechococcus phage ACG-2014h]|uniref:Uncharacterized protein n=1 Tax=Synechococcus phage ACG-2014h TaxID=1340810 RepID=V5UTA5_9CAUD|nr:hypothetical protein S-MbCM7_166 [Synechococcus phage ACG-2014h]AHB80580.1 hypothetical protein S-MbCM7_166 [Synechococcus phage ACG-2014h]